MIHIQKTKNSLKILKKLSSAMKIVVAMMKQEIVVHKLNDENILKVHEIYLESLCEMLVKKITHRIYV